MTYTCKVGEILLRGLNPFQKMESAVLPVAFGLCIFVRLFKEFKIALG